MATRTCDWFLLLLVNAIVLFCLALIVLPVSADRIVGKYAKPVQSFTGWIAKLFAVGIGIVLRYFGVLGLVCYTLAKGSAATPLGIYPQVPGHECAGFFCTIIFFGAGRLGVLRRRWSEA